MKKIHQKLMGHYIVGWCSINVYICINTNRGLTINTLEVHNFERLELLRKQCWFGLRVDFLLNLLIWRLNTVHLPKRRKVVPRGKENLSQWRTMVLANHHGHPCYLVSGRWRSLCSQKNQWTKTGTAKNNKKGMYGEQEIVGINPLSKIT